MAQFFNYDPLTGVREDFHYDEETGTAFITHSQDVTAALRKTKESANTGHGDKGIKKGLWNYATLPAVVQIQLRTMGIDVHSRDPEMQNRMLKAIDEHFPHFKNTSKKHRITGNKRH
jgi:hypothetical protein